MTRKLHGRGGGTSAGPGDAGTAVSGAAAGTVHIPTLQILKVRALVEAREIILSQCGFATTITLRCHINSGGP